MSNRFESDSVIPSVTETLRMQDQEQRDKAAGIETPASRLTAQKIAEQNNKR
ncbi:hypothetical protein [Micromonospora sp. NPDC050695]|uniref:hypothetical protein n=1 Tax=Micromonospora sp. NPDC050695 TaxID=3154938 RepID=UPI0034036C10